MNSVAEQSVADMAGRVSVLSRQKRDHIKLDQLLHRLAGSRGRKQDPLLLEIYRLVFPHAFAEEAVLWPVMRRALPNGHELTLRVELEHQEINELVSRLESLDPSLPEHQQVLDRVVQLLRQDVRDEEDDLLPSLQMKLTGAQLRLLGIAWEAVRRMAPTRAHPIVSRRPPGNVLAALPLSILDRCRDRMDAVLHRGAGAAGPPLEAVSSALTRASHAVERLPGMRRGEDPATRLDQRWRFGWRAAALVSVVTVGIMVGRAAMARSQPVQR